MSFIFGGDKVEGLYGAINKCLLNNGNQPVNIVNYSFFFNDPTVDPNNVRKTATPPSLSLLSKLTPR